MTPTEYLKQSARTTAKEFYPDQVAQEFWVELQYDVLENLKDLDRVKKATFYNRDVGYSIEEGDTPIQIHDDDVDTFHAVLGVLTEGAELLELIGTNAPRMKWLDEAGDVIWYLALLFRKHGISFEEVMEANIAKLKARFPEKFETDLANHRDEEAELLAQATLNLG